MVGHVSWRRKQPRTGPVGPDEHVPGVAPPVAGRTLTLVSDVDHRADSLLTNVTADLAQADSGIEFVYRSLDRLQQRGEAEDLLVIIDDEALGRQAFRAGRNPIETSWARELVRSGAPGVHATPTPVDGAVASSVLQLCTLALRLDVARHDALHDGLTGLLNRRAFDQVLATSCAQAQRYSWPFALVILDVDGFKKVNDRLGHAAGDATLRALGSELRHRLRVGDAAARIGGDEFALVLPNVGVGMVRELLDRIEDAIASAVPGAGVTVSSGYALAPEDGYGADALFRMADHRLYEVKQR